MSALQATSPLHGIALYNPHLLTYLLINFHQVCLSAGGRTSYRIRFACLQHTDATEMRFEWLISWRMANAAAAATTTTTMNCWRTLTAALWYPQTVEVAIVASIVCTHLHGVEKYTLTSFTIQTQLTRVLRKIPTHPKFPDPNYFLIYHRLFTVFVKRAWPRFKPVTHCI